jgi:HSP20 family molecular chaperone IbpA
MTTHKTPSSRSSLWDATDVANIVDSFFNSSEFTDIFNSLNTDSYPADQYWDADGNLQLVIPLAGYKKEDIVLTIEEDNLVLNVKKQNKVANAKYVQDGIRKKSIALKWYINDTFVKENIVTSFVDGLLTITLPVKAPAPKTPTRIQIPVK